MINSIDAKYWDHVRWAILFINVSISAINKF